MNPWPLTGICNQVEIEDSLTYETNYEMELRKTSNNKTLLVTSAGQGRKNYATQRYFLL